MRQGKRFPANNTAVLLHLLTFPLLSFSLLPLAIAAGSGHTAHLPDRPGNVQNDDDVCPSYERCKSAGFRLRKTLRDTIADPSHVDRAGGKPIYDAHYLSETIPLSSYGAGVRPDLQEHGISWQKMTLWASTPKDPETGEKAFDSAYGNTLDTANGVVIAIENTRGYDESRKLNWSEIIYQTWQRAMVLETEYAAAKKPRWVPGVNLSSFKYSIQNKNAEDHRAGVSRLGISDAGGRGEGLEAVDAGEDAGLVLCATGHG
ncbi:MAG: hypothetical protein Q9173_001284 [Seirophora scorigena]